MLGVSHVLVGRLTEKGRLPWLPTGRNGGKPARVYGRLQIEVIARARKTSGRSNVADWSTCAEGVSA
jgi:hypothetical protein